MIDWNKPIETTDGRKVTVLMLNAVHEGFEGANPCAVVKIEGDHRDKIGRYSTYLMDGSSWATEGAAPQIRNVPVKREGWVVARDYAPKNAAPLVERHTLYPTEAAARAACVLKRQFPMFISWEE